MKSSPQQDAAQRAANEFPAAVADLIAWQNGTQTRQQEHRSTCGVSLHRQVLDRVALLMPLSPNVRGGLNALLAALQAPAPGWIPVGERLPEQLANATTSAYVLIDALDPYCPCEVGYYDYVAAFFCKHDGSGVSPVLFWQPLPLTPSEL